MVMHMAAMRFSIPNWGQAAIAKAVLLDPKEVVVRSENEGSIVFLELSSRREYIVNKITGKVTEG